MTAFPHRGVRHNIVDAARRRPPDDANRAPQPKPQPSPPAWRRTAVFAAVLFLALFFGPQLYGAARTDDLSYSAFLTQVRHHDVTTVAVGSAGELTGTLKNGQRFTAQAPPWALTTDDLAKRLQSSGIPVSAYQQTDTLSQLMVSLLPTLLFVGAFVWLARRARRTMGSNSGGLGGLLRNKSRVTDAERPTTRFTDVAGYDGVKQEIHEVVDYLQHPELYRRVGATGPRGVLLVGPPGTGKTLLARAVAGEASVPFFAVTGSSFVEMFVGLGASRVRDLFAEARQSAPAIVFIDEIDAIGARRSVSGVGGNDERGQTLNQLLAELDGFTGDNSVVVLANGASGWPTTSTLPSSPVARRDSAEPTWPTEQYLRDSLAIRIGGRAAELLVLGQASTGAANDLAGATQLALRMIREYGFSAKLGPVAYPIPGDMYLGGTAPDRPYAEGTQRLVDREVSRLLCEAERRATELLTDNRAALDALTQRLLDEETVDGSVVYEIVNSSPEPRTTVRAINAAGR